MSLFSKIQLVATNPAMLLAYGRWVRSKVLYGRSPRLDLPGGAQIGEWLSFSEYWGFRNIMPEREWLFVKWRLSGREGSAVAFDVGANVGVFTCLMAAESHVHSFEPIPETFCRLKKNVRLNGIGDRVYLNCLAVGKEHGLVTFRIEEKAAGTNRMVLPGGPSTNSTATSQLVPVMSLDEYCRIQNIQSIDLLKVDVEGMETYVLQGSRSLLKERRIAAMLMEICPMIMRSVGLSPADLYTEFEAAGYSPYVLKDDGRPGAKLTLPEIEAMSLTNVVLLPDV